MISKCPLCSTRFRVSDEKLAVGPVKVRCPKCKSAVQVHSGGSVDVLKVGPGMDAPQPRGNEEPTHPAANAPPTDGMQPQTLANSDDPFDFGTVSFGDEGGDDLGGGPAGGGIADEMASLMDDDDGFDIGGGASFDGDNSSPMFPEDDDEDDSFDDMSDSVRTEESVLLDLALMDSGYSDDVTGSQLSVMEEEDKRREQKESAAKAGQGEVKGIDLARDAARREQLQAAGRGGGVARAMLVIVITLVGAIGFVAYRNDGMLDFKEFDQMLGVAFQGQEFQPRFTQYIRVVETEDSWIEERLDEPPELAPDELEAADIETGRYRTQQGIDLVIVEGNVVNRSENTFRGITLEVELVDSQGDVVHSAVVPAGNELAQPVLETVADEASLQGAYDNLIRVASALEIGPAQQTRFTAVFIDDNPNEPINRLSYSTRVRMAEQRTPSSCWSTVHFVAPGDDAESDDTEEEGSDEG